jgi:Protein of unknown function (DUF3800)
MDGPPKPFSDFIVYVDESGDHKLTKYDPEFPVFVLSFCVFRKSEYISRVVPALQQIKFNHFGHDMVVFHEREIRKASGRFAFLTDAARRTAFMDDINALVEASPFVIIAVAIRKAKFIEKHAESRHAYHFAMRLGLERVEKFLRRQQGGDGITHIIFEARGKNEDDELELEFRRVCDGVNYTGTTLDFQIIFPGKQVNCSGMQLADLTARPIGRYVLNPSQPNRAFEIIARKLDRSPRGKIEGYGLKTYP